MTVASRSIKTFLDYNPQATSLPLDDNGQSVQVVHTLADLARAQKMQYAAFVAREGILVVWDDEPLNIVARAAGIEQKLMDLAWAGNEVEEKSADDEKRRSQVEVIEVDPETGEVMPQHRPTHLMNTTLVALTLVLVVSVLGAGYRELAIEIASDKGWIRLAFLALTPIQVFFTLVSHRMSPHTTAGILTGVNLVLRTSHRRLFRSDSRSLSSDEAKLTLLLGQEIPTTHGRAATRYHSMPCLQGRLGRNYQAYHRVHQSRCLDV